jgi:hypothetical protein
MKEKDIVIICFIISLIGLILFFITYKPEFEYKTINQMLTKEGTKGIVFGKVTFILKQEPLIFFIENDNSAKVFYNSLIDIKKDDIVTIYGETKIYNGEKEIVALKVIKQ